MKYKDEIRDMSNRALADCCFEIAEWKKTGILRDGEVRRLSRIAVDEMGLDYGLRTVETGILEEVSRRWIELVGSKYENEENRALCR